MGRVRDSDRNEAECRRVPPLRLAGTGPALTVVWVMLAAGPVAAEPAGSDASGATVTAVAPAGAAEPVRERPDAPAAPLRWSTRSDYVGGNYRWAASRGAIDFGLRFDAAPRAGIVAPPYLDAAGPMVSNLPSVSLGLRTVTPSPTAASSLLERAIGSGDGAATSSSVGIEWKPAQSQLMFLRQGLGIRLGGDDRLTMQLRKGTLGIYMKRDF
jgi:hypothetical protein